MQSPLDITSTIFLGIVGGVLTSAILFVCVRVFNNVVVPWYQDLVYRGIDLSGRWYCCDAKLWQEITFDLTQKASSIYGSATFVNKGKTDHQFEDVRGFNVTGFSQDRFVHLVLKHKDKTRLGIITYLLESIGDGRRMKGVMSFYGVKGCRIDSSDQTIWREKSQADADRDKHVSELLKNEISDSPTPDRPVPARRGNKRGPRNDKVTPPVSKQEI